MSDPFAGMDKGHETVPRNLPKTTQQNAAQGKIVVPDLRGKTIREAAQELSAIGLKMDSDGSGVAQSQSVPPNSVVDTGTEVTVYFKPE